MPCFADAHQTGKIRIWISIFHPCYTCPMRCFACAGPYHPATGHLFRELDGVAYCGPCYRHFARWMKGHTNRRWSGADFYAEALVSCSARPLDRQPGTPLPSRA